MPVVMHFATFLKLLTQDNGDKIRDLEKYGKPGGWDFWRPLRDGMDSFVGHGRSRADIESDVRVNSTQTSQQRNLEVFAQAADWFERQSGVGFLPNRGVWRSPGRVFSVQIEPEIGLEVRNGSQLVVAIYGRNEPRIRRDYAGAAIVLLERAYRRNQDVTFGILDAAGNTLHRARSNVSEQLLDAEIAFIERELTRIMV